MRTETPEPTPKSRWRQRSEDRYARSKRKLRRNLGQMYTSDKTKNIVAARESCECKKRCRERLGGTETNVFNEFWNLGSWELQNSYLFGCISIVKKKRSHKKKNKNDRNQVELAVLFIPSTLMARQ